MAEQGRLVDEDLFTFTVAGQPLQDVNWLSQLCYHALYEAGGLALVQTVNALATGLTFLWLVLLCRRLSGSATAAALAGLLVFFGLWQVLTIRPQTFSLLLFVALYDLLDRAERRPWLLLVPPALLALWTNLHGAFPAGLLLVGCFLAASAWRDWRGRQTLALGGCLAATTLATLLNPYGLGIWLYVRQTSGRAAGRGILEWVPPDLTTLIGVCWAVSLVLLAALYVAAWRRGRRPAPREVFLMLCFLPLACGSVRMIAWWLIAVAPIVATLLADLLPRPDEAPRPSWGTALAMGLLGVAVVLSLPGLQHYNPLLGFVPREHAVEMRLQLAHERMQRQAATGRVFSRFEWGEYLGWAGAPRFPVFMDGRVEIVPDDVWAQYVQISRGREGWQEVLDAWKVDFLVLDAAYHAESGLLGRVRQSPHWQQTQRVGGDVLVFERTGALTRRRTAAGP
jgi:hypothetical protein